MDMLREETYEQVDSLPLPLNLFVKKYSGRLPQVIAVNESLYGICSDSFTEGQLMQVFFHKETPVIIMKRNGGKDVIPTASALKYSLLYDPQNDTHAAKTGYKFVTVADLIKCRNMPNVVYVGKSCSSSSYSLQKGQILIIKSIEVVSKSVRKLKCLCIESGKLITLDENCKGHFSTQPSLTSMDISILLKHFQLPQTVLFYSTNSSHPKMQRWFINDQLGTITDHYTMQSVIASFCPLDDQVDTDGCKHILQQVPTELVEILSDVAIDVRIVKLSDDEMIQLKINADILSKSLSTSCIKDVITNTLACVNPFQKELLMLLTNEEFKNNICNLDTTEYEIVPFKTNPPSTINKSDVIIDNQSQQLSPTRRVTSNPPPPPIPPRPTRNKKNPPLPLKSKVYEDLDSNTNHFDYITSTPPPVLKTYDNFEPLSSRKKSVGSPPPAVPPKVARSISTPAKEQGRLRTNTNPSYHSSIRERMTTSSISGIDDVSKDGDLIKELETLRESNAMLVQRLQGLENSLLSEYNYYYHNKTVVYFGTC
jgi:hypothetical protein